MIAHLGLAAAIAMVGFGCDRVECGDGTSEVFGECVAGSGADPSVCGTDTVWDPALQVCVGVDPVSCERATTETLATEDGTTVCWSFHSECFLSCPAADPGKVSLCGRLVDGESGDPIEPLWGELCDPANPIDDGVCSLAVSVRDAVTGGELAVGEATVNRCGELVLENVAAPASGVVAIAVDDAVADDRYATTLTALAVEPGQRVTGLRAYALRHRADDKWTAGAGLTGDSFAERGVGVAIFRHKGEPVPGVAVTADGAAVAAGDYYLNDGDHERSLVDAGAAITGANGTALWLGGASALYSGQGGEIDGCQWPELALAAAAPGAVVFAVLDAVDPDTGEVCE